MEIRELSSHSELARCETLEDTVWGLKGRGGVPATQLVAAVHAGGLVAGAFDGSEMAGHVYGFPSHRASQPPGHHSHILAVLPQYRSHGIGRALKAFQRNWCLRRGITWMTWTFDPLQNKNARFNLEHLGAQVREYRVNEYGTMEDALNAGLPSDRLLAYWELERASPRSTEGLEHLPQILTPARGGAPEAPELSLTAGELALYTPDLPELRQQKPELALQWRLASRVAFLHYFKEGYLACGFRGGRYLLLKPHHPEAETAASL